MFKKKEATKTPHNTPVDSPRLLSAMRKPAQPPAKK